MPSTSAIGELVLKFTADIADILSNTERIKSEMSGLAGDVQKAISDVTETIGGIAEAFAAFESIKFAAAIVGQSIEAQASLEQLSEKTGITVETLSGLSNAGAVVGLSIDNSSRLIERFEKNLNDAASGTGKASDALTSLGFSAQQLGELMKNPDQAFLSIAQRLGDFRDGVGKTTAEMDLFGRAGAELAPFLKQLAEQGQLNSTVSTEQARAAEDLRKQWNTLTNQGQQLINQVVAQMIPTFSALVGAIDTVVNAIFGMGGGIRELISSGAIAAWAQQQGLKIAQLADMFVDIKNGVTNFFRAIADGVAVLGDFGQILFGIDQILRGQVAQGIETVRAGWAGMKDDAKKVGTDISNAFTNSTAAQDAYTAKIIEGQTQVGFYAAESEKAALAVTKVSKAHAGALNALSAYNKSVTDLAKAQADATAKIEIDAIKNAQADLKTELSRGLLDWSAYWSQKVALEQEALDASSIALQSDIAQQKTYIAQLQQQLLNLDVSKFKTQDEIDKARLELKTKINVATIALTKSEAQLAVVEQNEGQVGKDNIEVYTQFNSLLFQSVEALQKKIDAGNLEIETLGLTQSQTLLVTAARAEEKLMIDLMSGAIQADMVPALQAEIDKMRELAGVLASKEGFQSQISGWNSILQEADTVFQNILNHGKNTWQQLTDWLKSTLLKLLIQMTEQQFIVPIIFQISGPQVAQSIASSLGTSIAGNPFSLFSGGGGSNLLSSLGLGDLPSLGTAFSNLGTILPTFNTMLDAGATAGEALDAAFAGMGLSLGVATLGIGAAVAAALYFIDKSKTPSEVQGQFGISAGTTGFEDNASVASKYFGNVGFLDAGTKYFSGQAAKAFDTIIASALDAVGSRLSSTQITDLTAKLQNTQFQQFQGTYTTEDFISKYGGQVLSQVLGEAISELDAKLGTLASGFKGSAQDIANFADSLLQFYDTSKNLPDSIKTDLESAIGETQASIDNINKIATAAANIFSLTTLDPTIEAQKAIAQASQDAYAAFNKQHDALESQIAATDGSADSLTKLATASTDFYAAGVKLLAQIEQIKTNINGLFTNTIQQFKDSTETPAQKYADYQQQAADLITKLQTETDPFKIEQYAQQINDLFNKAFGVLTPDQQKQMVDQFINQISRVNDLVQQQLNTASSNVAANTQDPIVDAANKMQSVADSMASSAAVQKSAADEALIAAKTPLTVRVDVTDQGTTTVGNFG